MGYRADLKSRAKACLRNYYWAAVVVLLVSSLGGLEWSSIIDQGGYGSERPGLLQQLLPSVVNLDSLLLSAVTILLAIFVGNALEVGACRFFMESREKGKSAGISKVFYAFRSGSYLNVVKTMFIRDLFTFLWGLLLVIPGIIKLYQYYLVPYILSENPDMDYREALNQSRDMMDGNKWFAYVLGLSFIGWYLLILLVCGFCGGMVMAILPFMDAIILLVIGICLLLLLTYVNATVAEMYAVLRNNVYVTVLNGFGGGEEQE